MIIWQRCWITKEYNEVKLKKISFNLPLSWWGYKTPKDRGSPVKDPPVDPVEQLIQQAWSIPGENTPQGSSRDKLQVCWRKSPHKNQNNSKRQLQAKGVYIPPCSTFSFYKQKLVISQSKGAWRWSEHTLKPQTNSSNKTTGTKVKELMEDMGLIGAPYSTLIIYQNRPTQGQIKSYRVGRGNSRPERMRPDKYCSRLKRNNMET